MALQQCPVCRGTNFEVCAVNPAHTINCGVSVFTKRISNAICTGCGLVQNVPSFSDEELAEIYRAMTRNVQDGVKVDWSSLPIEHAQHDFITQYFQQLSGASVFDIGCSLGGFLELFKQKGANVVGCEPSEADGRVAKARGIEIIPRMFEVGDYALQSFDLVTLRFVFEHLRDPSAMLRDLRTLLKPTGAIFIEVPDLAHPFVGLDDFFSFGHTFTFSRETLQQAAERSGYRVVALTECDNRDLPRRTFPSLRMIATPSGTAVALASFAERSRGLVADYEDARRLLIQQIGYRLEAAHVRDSKNLVIYGAGTHSAELIHLFPWLLDRCIAFVDGNRDLQGKQYFERPVLSPEGFSDLGFDQIVISAREAESEIFSYLATLGLSVSAVRLYGE